MTIKRAEKLASELQPGDRIPVPAHERKWLQGTLTVVSVRQDVDRSGRLWVYVRANYFSPYSGELREAVWTFKPSTAVTVFNHKGDQP